MTPILEVMRRDINPIILELRGVDYSWRKCVNIN